MPGNLRVRLANTLGSLAFLVATCLAANAQANTTQQAFEQARILRSQGEHDSAIDILRGLLRAQPENVALREELGYALILDGQMAAAQYQFEILKTRVRDPELRGLYVAVLRRIVAERPIGVSLIFGFTPTTNLNQGTDNTTLQNDVLGAGVIAPESRRLSGWAARIGLRGYVRRNIGANGRIVFDWRAEQHLYSAFYAPETDAEIGLSLMQNMRRGDIGFRVFTAKRWRARGDYSRVGLTVFGGREVGQGRRIGGYLQFSKLDQDVSSDSMQTVLDVGYAFAPSPGLALRYGLQGARVNASRDAQSYSSLAATMRANTAFRGGYEVSAQATAGHRRFDTALGFAREDSFADISVTLFNSRFSVGGVVPKLTCSLSATFTNVALFDTRTRACGLALSRRF